MILVETLGQLGFAGGRPVIAALGNFDGLHRGHQAIMVRVRERAAARHALAVVVTFEPHPRRLLDPEGAPRMLLARSQKLALLEAMGLDAVALLPFDRSLAAMPAEEFARDALGRRLGAVEIHIGEDFRFGRGRAGDLRLLNMVGRESGFAAFTVPPVMEGGARISSSRIRATLDHGDVAAAAALLGRPFALIGTIVHGEGRGGAVLVPTANLAPENEFLPGRGVYITATRHAGATLAGLTNVGVRPTFGDLRLVVETFLPDFAGDLYGARVELDFLERLREERRFDAPGALLAQIRQDLAAFDAWRGRRESTARRD